jgi:hypothetical protein
MIRRRSFIAGICSFVVAPSAMRALLTVPVSATSRAGVDDRTAGPDAPPVVFRIQGWDQNDLNRTEKAGQHDVVIHLTNSWRSAWL